MLILANFINAIAAVLGSVIHFVTILVIARVIVSWLNADPNNTLVRIILSSTEPLLQPIARLLKLRTAGVDFTPIVLLLLLMFTNHFVVQTTSDYAQKIRRQELMQAPLDPEQIMRELQKFNAGA